jgi:hypothetical protein
MSDRLRYDTAASAQVQSAISGLIGRLESLVSQRDAQVRKAMSGFQADGVSDLYYAKELQWRRAADDVRSIVALVRSVLSRNDETAVATLAQARSAVANIG